MRRAAQEPIDVRASMKCCKKSPASSSGLPIDDGLGLRREHEAIPVNARLTTRQNNCAVDGNHRKDRFAVGDEVDCCDADGWWFDGVVVALTHSDSVEDDMMARYQVMLNGDNRLVWASDGTVRTRSSRTSDQRPLPERVEDAVAEQIESWDSQRTLHADDFFCILTDLTETVTRVMNEEARQEFDDKDRAFITQSVRRLVHPGPGASEAMILTSERSSTEQAAEPRLRLRRLDHVVLRLPGQRQWASGVVHAIDESSADNEVQEKLQYVHVMLDEPDGMSTNRLVAVPEDACHLQRSASSCAQLKCPRSPRSPRSPLSPRTVRTEAV